MAETITAIAALLWPLTLLVLLAVFRKPLAAVVRSAGQREWTLEVGGHRLSMGELSDQQNFLIADLQTQISALHRQIAELRAGGVVDGTSPDPDLAWSLPATGPADVEPVPNAVLWVDDNPANNALIAERLQQNGVRVDLASSTADGLARLRQRRYGAVLSDMGRVENGSMVSDAGLRLLSATRETHPTIPFLIYCGPTGATEYREAATSVGADVITASPAVLADRLRSLGLL